MPKFAPRTGLAAIEEAATAKSGGKQFQPFVPELRLREDGEQKYILVLTPINEVATLDLHEWVPVGKGERANCETYTRYETFLSRKDPLIGEDYDDISDRLERPSKTRCYGVAVELEPVMETVRGRNRPKSFIVKTETFTRKTEDGEQEVTAPVIGLIVQSAALVWSPLGSLDEAQGPLSELPLQMTRRGKDQNTRYDFVPYMDIAVDLSPVISHLDGISYLGEVIDDVVAAIDATEDELGAAQAVASFLYDRRLEELADKDRYDELVSPIEELEDRFGGNKKVAKGVPARKAPKARVESKSDGDGSSSKADRFAELKAKFDNKSE